MANFNRLKIVLAEQQKNRKMACRTDWEIQLYRK